MSRKTKTASEVEEDTTMTKTTTTTRTPWTEVVLTDGGNEFPATRAALQELRATDTLCGVWACTRAQLEAYIAEHGDDTSAAGLGRDDIDWTLCTVLVVGHGECRSLGGATVDDLDREQLAALTSEQGAVHNRVVSEHDDAWIVYATFNDQDALESFDRDSRTDSSVVQWWTVE